MPKLYEVKSVCDADRPALKRLWHGVFGDSYESIDNFFNKTAQNDKIVACFCDNEPVSALYLLDCDILLNGSRYGAYYVYAVCTAENHRGIGLMKKCFSEALEKAEKNGVSYLFLVPAEKSLFDLYASIGFTSSFYCEKKTFLKKDFSDVKIKTGHSLKYSEYTDIKRGTVPVALLGEKTFASFFSPAEDDIKVIHLLGDGYAVAEKSDEKIIVHEIFGDTANIMKKVFEEFSCDVAEVRLPALNRGEPCGMLLSLNGAEKFTNGFFGIPYGG